MRIDRYNFPDDLLYDKEHNWALVDGNVATIGMTDFGQDLAGEIVYAEVPRVGRELAASEPFMSLESGKWVGRIKAIVSGTIVEANEEIECQGRDESGPSGSLETIRSRVCHLYRRRTRQVRQVSKL